jgi:hypothetical protein
MSQNAAMIGGTTTAAALDGGGIVGGGVGHPSGSRRTKIEVEAADVVSAFSQKIKEKFLDHPGNVYFSQLVDKYSVEYIKLKVENRKRITKKVIDSIYKHGGRFLRVEGGSTSGNVAVVECDERAAAGRVTKELRKRGLELLEEQQQQHRKKGSISTGPQKKPSSLKKKKIKRPAGATAPSSPPQPSSSIGDVNDSIRTYMSPKRTKIGVHHGNNNSNNNNINDNGISHWTSPSGDRRTSSHRLGVTTAFDASDPNDTDDDDNHSALWHSLEQNSERIETDVSWNAKYQRLTQFYSTNGHTGVPNNWRDDPDLAEWACRQRQLFREIRSGYRIATFREEGRWKRLQDLDFPLDYDQWHWQRKYNQVRAGKLPKKNSWREGNDMVGCSWMFFTIGINGVCFSFFAMKSTTVTRGLTVSKIR